MNTRPTHILRFADLPTRKETRFDLTPDADACAALAAELEVDALRKLRFVGTIRPRGSRDWVLRAELGASVTQSCVVTLDPVITRIDDAVLRAYAAQWDLPSASEVEMPADTDTDPLPETLDLYDVVLEELSLAVPRFPRAEGAELGSIRAAAPGVTPMTDADTKPFAGLAGLRDSLAQNSDPDE